MRKYSFAGIFLTMLILLNGTVTAQNTCGAIDEESCRLLSKSTIVMTDVKSLVFDIDSVMIFEDVNTPGLSNASININLDGSYGIGESTAPIFSGPMQQVISRLKAINSEIEIEFSVPTFGFSSAAFGAELRLVDGIGYLNADDFFTLMNPNDSQGWFAFDIVEVLPDLLDESMIDTFAEPLFPTTVNLEDNAVNDFTHRAADTHIDGIPMAVFETSFVISDFYDDFSELELEEELVATLRDQYGAFYSDENLEEAARAYAELFDTMKFEWTRSIGLVDNYLHRFEFAFELDADEDIELSPDADPLGINLFIGGRFAFELDMRLTEFDNAPMIAAPFNPTIITLDDLLPLLTPGSPI